MLIALETSRLVAEKFREKNSRLESSQPDKILPSCAISEAVEDFCDWRLGQIVSLEEVYLKLIGERLNL